MRKRCCDDAKYGNCGPIKHGDFHCLFHKPNKDKKETKEFYAKLREQAEVYTTRKGEELLVFKDVVNWKGYVFPGSEREHHYKEYLMQDVGCLADFENSVFQDKVNFRYTIFEGNANFSSVTFENKVDFAEASFYGHADFSGMHCKETASFRNALFLYHDALVDFSSAVFESFANINNVNFKGAVLFIYTIFQSRADFLDTTLRTACFTGAIFGNEARFRDILFKRCGHEFEEAVFINEPCVCETLGLNLTAKTTKPGMFSAN